MKSLSTNHLGRALGLATLAVGLTFPSLARAEGSIRHPGDHLRYTFEAEPHLTLGFNGPIDVGGILGIGFRGTFPIVHQGFVRTINNSVGINVGLDLFPHDGKVDVLVPVAMQWNFWFTKNWSAFGEPGFVLGTGQQSLVPMLAVGGRYLFTDSVALVFRAGFPAFSVGTSFLF
jgi:hypothetical protein